MANAQFDGLPGLEGQILSMTVTDTDGNPNLVIDDENDFLVDVAWEVTPPVTAAVLDGAWDVDLYAESVGPGPDLLVASEKEPATGATTYSHRFIVKPPYGGMTSKDTPPPDSGIYQLSVALTYRNKAGIRLEIAGFYEGQTVMLREP